MDSKESITLRLAKLNQCIDGKGATESVFLSRDALLDSLLALFEECERKQHNQRKSLPQHVANFLRKADGTIADIKRLRVNLEDFEVVKLIGQGHFGQVKVVREKITGEVFALKVIRKRDVICQQEVVGTDGSASYMAAYFEEERDIMSKSKSAWLTQLQYAFQDTSHLYLAMDFHPGGDLSILLSRYETLSEDMTCFYIAEMCQAIHAVHTLGYVHRDVKPDNFLIDRIGHLKLTDFGSAAKMNSQGKVCGKMPVGTPDYIAPELLTSMTSGSDKQYNRLVDWWSMGIITYEMVCGQLPFSTEECSVVTTYSNIIKYKEKLVLPPQGVTLSTDCKQFIAGLLTESKYRMGYDQITAHKLLSQLDIQLIRNSTPPYIPKVASNDDTSNFEEVVARPHSPRDDVEQIELRDLPFIGFTTCRNLALLKAKQTARSSTSGLVDQLLSPPRASHQGCSKMQMEQLERREASYKKELDKMRSAFKQKDAYIDKLENERETQNREMAYLYATNSDLADQNKVLATNLESTRGVYEEVLGETEDFMRVFKSREKDQTEYEDIISQELENLKSELQRIDSVVVEKDIQLGALTKKMERVEKERAELVGQLEQERKRADRAVHQLSDYQKADRHGTLVVKCEIETQHMQSEQRVTDLQQQLDKVMASNRASQQLLEQMKDEKSRIEQELTAVRSISARRQIDRDSELKRHTISDTDKMKLARLEARSSQLSGELLEKSKQAQQLAMKISELTDQVEEAHKKCLTEKQARLEVEKSLRERIQQLERQLSSATSDVVSLRSERNSVSDQLPESKRIVSEHEQTIAILQANVEKLENLVVGMRDGFDEKEQRRDQRGRQETRRWAEIVGELKQENMYLERKIEHLNTQLQAKTDCETTYKERLKTVRDDLQQVKAKTESEVAELNKRALEAEVKMSDAKSEAISAVQSERVLRRQFDNLKKQLRQSDEDNEQQRQHLLDEKATLCSQIDILKEETQIIDELEAEVTRLAEKCAMLDAENKSLKEQTSKALEAKANALMTLSGMESDKLTAERRADSVNEELRRLKLVCTEMELNAEDLERLVEELEKKQETHASDRRALESRISHLQNKTERLEASLHAEHSQRQSVDERNERAKQSLQAQLSSQRSKEENLHHDLEQQRITIDRLRKQVQQHESDIGHLDKERRSVKVKLSQAEDDIRKLKEETSTWKTQVNNLKAVNCRLQTDLELLVDQLEQVTEKKHVVENSMENLVLTKEQEQYRSEQTLSQQSKLIDFLQQKYEAPMKKKSGSKLFSHKREGQQEFVQALESERSRSRKLEDKVKDLKTELFHTKVSSFKGSRDLSTFSESLQDTPRPDPVGFSDSSDDSKSSTHRTMKHNIPHRLSTKMNTRATKCAVCQLSVRFGQPAAKCQECYIVTHEGCKESVTPTCGLPSQFMQLYAKTLEQKSLNSAGGVLEADLRLVELGGWMKVQWLDRRSSGWVRRFVLVEKGALSFYLSDESSAEACEIIDLNGYTSVNLISDVNPAELQSVASSDDMPYIIKLELRSASTFKVLYLLTANFAEKEKWDSTLEAIVEHGSMADVRRQETRLMGNRLLQLDKGSLSEVNCTMLLGENDVLLLGAEEGLYACQLSYTSEPLVRVNGVSSVYQIHALTIPGQLLLLTGQDRRLCATSYAMLKDKLSDRQSTISGSVSMVTERVGSVGQCTMFSCSELDNRCTIAAATADYIFVIFYSNTNKCFSVRQQVAIVEPCSCICYTPSLLLFGTDTLYKLTINNGCIRPFLKTGVKENTSYDSLPIDILSISDGQLLCCFTDVGIFVNSCGERSRADVIQWAGLPLSFAYRTPYLYVIYYKALQVIGPLDSSSHQWNSNQTFLNIPSPRYLGPAYTDGAVYVASLQDAFTDILVFRGNLTMSVADSDSGSDTTNEPASEFSCSSQEEITREFYHRNNKENHPKKHFPTMIQRYQAAALRTGILPSRQQNGNSSSTSSSSTLSTSSSSTLSTSSSSTSSTSSSSQSNKSSTPINPDYFNNMYGAGRKKAGSHTTPHHSNV